MKTYVFALLVLAILPFQMACELDGFLDSERYKEDFQYSYNLKPGGKLSIENFNGSIEILSWEKDSVQITGTKYAATESDLKDLKIEIAADAGSVRIRTVRPSEFRRSNMGAKYFIRLPRQVELERVASSNGSVRVEEVQGSARLETSNGSVRLRKLAGRLEVKTSNGAIEGEDLECEAVLRTSNGAIRIGRMSGSVDATTSNGSINVRIDKPGPRQPMRFESSNGSIEVAFESLADNDVRANTSNSSITLRLPAAARARLRAHTSHGSIHSDFDVATKGSTLEKNELDGEIGGGGPLLNLSSSNGTIRVLKL
jgi:DUF4097 and DUF4098 domain-containing protein YvlB